MGEARAERGGVPSDPWTIGSLLLCELVERCPADEGTPEVTLRVVRPVECGNLALVAALERVDDPPATIAHEYDLTYDRWRRLFYRNGELVDFTLQERKVFEYMVANWGRLLEKDQILSNAWDHALEGEGDANTLRTRIRSVRHKLGPAGVLIVTCQGEGYRFERQLRAS